jgi:Cytochrome P450
MELAFLSLPCLLIPSLLLSLTFLFLKRNKAKSRSNLPPGPSSIPFLGNLHHIAICSCPHQTLRDFARSLGPVMLLRTGDVKLLVISSPDAAKEVSFAALVFMHAKHIQQQQ